MSVRGRMSARRPRPPAAPNTIAILGSMAVRTAPPVPQDADEPLGREVWIVAAVVIVGVIMSILDTTIVNVALETLSRELDASLNTIQWVSTGYMLALAVVIPLTGWMSERFGAKRVWMVSVALFGLGSALCGLAWSAESLIFFRVLQGFGGGMIMPVGMSVLAQTAGPHRVGRVMAVIGVPMLLGPIFGPVIGGLIVDNASWRWIFFVNVPIAIARARCSPRGCCTPTPGRADAGPARLDRAAPALARPRRDRVRAVGDRVARRLHGADRVGADRRRASCSSRCSCATRARAERPLIDVRLFRDRVFSAAAATTFLLGGALFGAMIILPLYYQVGARRVGADGRPADGAAGPRRGARRCRSPGKLTDRIGGGRVAVAGLLILTARRRSRSRSSTADTLVRGARAAARPARHRDRLRDDAGDGRRVRDARRAPPCRARRAR